MSSNHTCNTMRGSSKLCLTKPSISIKITCFYKFNIRGINTLLYCYCINTCRHWNSGRLREGGFSFRRIFLCLVILIQALSNFWVEILFKREALLFLNHSSRPPKPPTPIFKIIEKNNCNFIRGLTIWSPFPLRLFYLLLNLT